MDVFGNGAWGGGGGGGGRRRRTLGLSRLCSATFEQRFGVWSNFLRF